MFRHIGLAARRAPVCALAVALLAAPPAAACPEAQAPAASAQSASAAGARPAVWDWYANARPGGAPADRAAIVRVVDRQRLGTGSWICSPAGSGMRSGCFQR